MEIEASEVAVEDGAPTLEQLTKVYIKIRDNRRVLEQAFKVEDEKLQEQIRAIEEQMLDICKKFNASSIKTEAGTIIRSVKSRYWTNDWDSMYQFIRENSAFALLERRLHQSHMKQFLEENPDLTPAGLNVDKEYTVVVRRSKEG
jgi:hypothetical protein